MAFSLKNIQKAQRRRRGAVPALPPLGSFDPSILLQVGQNRRTAENAQQQFDLGQAQAQDDFGIQTQRLAQQEGNSLADLVTGRQRLSEDRTNALADLGRGYGSLAHRQAEGALRANVQSAGLLAQSLAARKANMAHDQAGVDQSYNRSLADSTTAEQRLRQDVGNRKADLALTLSRAYGSGKGGQPLGTNVLNLLQTKNDALSGNLDLTGVAFQQAAANGYTLPRRRKVRIV